MLDARGLQLGNSGFKGTIPAGIYKLTKLTFLDVRNNKLHDAPIPNAISRLVNLECVEWSSLGPGTRARARAACYLSPR